MRALDQFPAATTRRYPWEQLMNGQPWELVHGEDFHAKPLTFISNARTQARRRGGSARTRILQEGERTLVVVQFVPAS